MQKMPLKIDSTIYPTLVIEKCIDAFQGHNIRFQETEGNLFLTDNTEINLEFMNLALSLTQETITNDSISPSH